MLLNAKIVGDQSASSTSARLRLGLRSGIILLAIVDQWFLRYSMNPDGVSYLDLGDAFWRGDWKTAFNVCWSPLYGWLIGMMFRVIHPSIAWEFPEVHLLNLGILCIALFSFEFFWNEALETSGLNDRSVTSSRYAWAIGYLIFLKVHLDPDWTGIVSPDQLVAVFSYVIFGLLLRFNADRDRTPAWLIGLLCGLGYLSKTPMLILSVICFAMLFTVRRNRVQSARPIVEATVVFLAVTVPFVVALSIEHDEITIGDAGKINIVWHVNKTSPEFEFWEGSESNQAQHPVRRLNSWPAVYEFASPIPGTYPPWYDPSYWYAGADSRFHLTKAITAASTAATDIAKYGFKLQGILTGVVAITFLLSDNRRLAWRRWLRFWPIIIPSMIYFGMFGAIHWEPRYTFAEAVVLWGTIAVSAEMGSEIYRTRVLTAIAWGLAIVICPLALHDTMEFKHSSAGDKVQVEVAEKLHKLGMSPGDRIAVIGNGKYAFWARLAKTKIIAEIPNSERVGDPAAAFWNSTPAEKSAILALLKGTGAVIVVADRVPAPLPPDWIPLGNTGFAMSWLDRQNREMIPAFR